MTDRVLICIAHPDDEMHVSGTAALQTAAGLPVTIAVACNGNLGGPAHYGKQERAAIRRGEMEAACKLLRADLEWLGYGDDDFMDRYHNDYIGTETAFRNLVRRLDPALLIIPPLDDYHQHHRAVAELALNASLNAGNSALLSEEPASSGVPPVLHMPPMPPTPFEPSVYVDITPTLELKQEALRCHASQHQYLQDHHRTDIFKQVEAAAVLHGAACGCRYAEAFSFCRRFNRLTTIQSLARFFAPAQERSGT